MYKTAEFGFERSNKLQLSEREKTSLQELLEKFSDESPNLDDFDRVYEDQEIAKDRLLVRQLKERFDKGSKELKEQQYYARVLEMIIMEFGNSWILGVLTKATEFDDYVNSTDLFLESQVGEENIIIAIDVTSSKNTVVKKVQSLLKEIHEAQFHSVKYFKSDLLDEEVGKIKVPKIIVGADREIIVEIGRLYIRYNEASDSDTRNRFRDLISKHRFGNQMAVEIVSQIKLWITNIERLNKNKYKRQVEGLRQIILELETKQKEPPHVNESPNMVEKAILDTLQES